MTWRLDRDHCTASIQSLERQTYVCAIATIPGSNAAALVLLSKAQVCIAKKKSNSKRLLQITFCQFEANLRAPAQLASSFQTCR